VLLNPWIDGRNGFIADDTETCAERTLRLIQDRNLWHKLGKAARATVKQNYLLPMMVLQYLDVLKKALGMSRAAGQPQAVLDMASIHGSG
jgi:trehalose synthase